MANHIYYAVQNVRVTPENDTGISCAGYSNTGICESGMISCGFSSTAEYTPVFQLGRLGLYDIVDGVTAVEATVERYIGANSQTLWGTITGNNLATAIAVRPKIELVTIDDTDLSCSVTPDGYIRSTGLYITNYSLNYPLDGGATETMTFVGSHYDQSAANWGGSISGILTAFSSDGSQVVTRTDLSGAFQSVTASVSIGREDLFQFGSREAYHKAPTFPIESTMTFESLAKDGDGGPGKAGGAATSKTFDRVTIANAYLTATEYGGGASTGGNATITETYTGYNDFSCTN